nr:MAG TPA: hypothetical protein [Bacteriophage sp.]
MVLFIGKYYHRPPIKSRKKSIKKHCQSSRKWLTSG